jgi:hypothetical protein
MSDRVQRLRDLLDRRAKEFRPPAEVPAGLIGRARRSMAIAALVVVLTGAVVGYGAFASVRALRGQSVPAVSPSGPLPSLSPAPAASPVPTPSEIGIPGTSVVLPLAGSVDQLAVGPGALYAAYYPTGDTTHEVIARFDLQTHLVVRSLTLPAAIDMTLSTGLHVRDVLWVVHWTNETSPRRVLLGLDSTTLAVVVDDVVPFEPADHASPISQVLATPAGLWVSAGSSLFLLDLGPDLHWLTRTDLDGTVGSMVADPSGRFLYVLTLDQSGASRSIDEIKASPQTEPQTPPTGSILEQSPVPFGVGVNGLAASVDGVWAAFPTGLLGSLMFFRASDLKQTANYVGQGDAPVTNTMNAFVTDGTLWVTDGMIGVVACADPAVGHLRSVVIPQAAGVTGFSNVTSVGSTVYVGIVGGVLSITPNSRCLR